MKKPVTRDDQPPQSAAITWKYRGSFWVAILVTTLALLVTIRSDLDRLREVSELSAQGSPPPERDANSSSGYVLGQRHFLGIHERGDTFRWIALTQEVIASGIFASPTYHGDNAPEGRTQLMPRLYAVWLATVSEGIHLITGEPTSIAVEKAALWEPVTLHILAFIAAAMFMGFRYGAVSGAATALFLAYFPAFSGQFLPGVLTPRTWALLLATYAIARSFPPGRGDRNVSALGTSSAVATTLALWLDPAWGFPAVVIAAAAAVAEMLTQKANPSFLRWSLLGSSLALVAWLIDRSPWTPAVGELRYVHPLYALAWLGIGLGLDGWKKWREAEQRRPWPCAQIVVGMVLLSGLIYTQLHHGYKGWLYPSAAIRRLTSLDETKVFNTAVDWFTGSSATELIFFSAPILAALVVIVSSAVRRRNSPGGPRSPIALSTVVFAGVLAFAFFKVRWIAVVVLVVLPIIWNLARDHSVTYRRVLLGCFAGFLTGLFVCGKFLEPPIAPRPADLEALVFRHFSHWLSSHNAGQKLGVLASPEFSDSIVFHGSCRALMSTAWESYPGQVAASRILSAPESSEAEAVLQSREITHLILTSWDQTLPRLVRSPDSEEKNTLYARLQRWVLPPYLRPIPYQLPATPGFLDQKIAVFKVTAPQDEALSLSRLAEYFVEMNRDEPARLVARVLAQSYPDDPNAGIARAIVDAHTKNQEGFDRELARLSAEVTANLPPSSWDRRVQRAIVFALGHRHESARKEVALCLAEISTDNIFDLTPLQAYRLITLAKNYGLDFPNPNLAGRVAALGSEYHTASAAAR